MEGVVASQRLGYQISGQVKYRRRFEGTLFDSFQRLQDRDVEFTELTNGVYTKVLDVKAACMVDFDHNQR